MTSDDRMHHIVKRFYDASTTCSLEISEQLGMSQLQVNQIHYLKLIDEHDSLTFSLMAELLGITKPSVTEIVNKLIRLECVTKTQSPDDGRVYFIELSEKGRNIARSRALSENKIIELILKKLDPNEVETFIRLLDKISG
ncbi:MarR family winged helix-turn-helix transcriptional regulator [Desulfoluna butyratoxydans]|uniref:Marr-type hth domain n=1 Tax=Desulfoluna butyratoxydans TaxID=231438 RepID=A0A4U8YY61_9BACT|nr:MarR family winged helix-turn-helix transcriptional regulator [Desulfoluna butyratoxydans]VFQ47042.1 marr-type hth domain [Desulfoluna butyratoxydans]